MSLAHPPKSFHLSFWKQVIYNYYHYICHLINLINFLFIIIIYIFFYECVVLMTIIKKN